VSLAQRFQPRHNSLNALRLALATLVVVSHAWPLTGLEPEPGFGGANLGTWAVFGFFAISGFLITRSRLRTRRPANAIVLPPNTMSSRAIMNARAVGSPSAPSSLT
jgi:peptidoglycan/LPS O-acetylase OafA/YrhL